MTNPPDTIVSALPEDDEKLIVALARVGERYDWIGITARKAVRRIEARSREIAISRALREDIRDERAKWVDAEIALNRLLKRMREIGQRRGPEVDEAEAVLENINEESSLIEQRVRAETLEEAAKRLRERADMHGENHMSVRAEECRICADMLVKSET